MKRTALALAFVFAAALGACDRSTVSSEIEKQDAQAAADAAKAKQANAAFLAENKAKPGVTTTKSGLQIEVLRAGDKGLPTPGPSDEVTVMYEGKLIDNSVFDSSYQRGQPVSFEVGGVIPGWTEALQLMHPGEMAQLVLPPEIGYATEAKPSIPANSVLIFKVELLGFRKSDGTLVPHVAAPAAPAASDAPAKPKNN